MVGNVHRLRANRPPRVAGVLVLCALLLTGALGTPAAPAHAGDVAEATASAIFSTQSLPANFAGALRDSGMVLMSQENLEALGYVLFELQLDCDTTGEAMLERLNTVFPGHRFEHLKQDALDYELSAF